MAQSRRLGHILGDKIQETYSHVAAEVETRLLGALNERWLKAVADQPGEAAWRQPPRSPSTHQLDNERLLPVPEG